MKRHTTLAHFETPTALRHDAQTLAEDTRALLEATAEMTDEKITAARERLASAMEAGRDAFGEVRDGIKSRAKAVDRTVHEHPYPTLGIAFGLGAILGYFFRRS